MRLLLILWAAPLAFFWGWYGLSANDINFGFNFLRREMHDIIFQLYGKILGVPPADVPWMLAKVFALDSLFIGAIAAWRWRKSWYPQTKAWLLDRYAQHFAESDFTGSVAVPVEVEINSPEEPAIGPAHPAE